MPLPFSFDFKNPDYRQVFEYRMHNLKKIRSNPSLLNPLKTHYKNNIIDFINDWGMTYDPRLAQRKLPAAVPFILFPKQEEWVHWLLERWQKEEPGITVKSRDCGISWLLVAVFSSLGLFNDDLNFGLGSRKSEYVDEGGAPKSLFFKARKFISLLPPEFKCGWDESNKRHTKHMLISFPNGSTISGECGDSIGRGDRAAIYGIDESAAIEHPDLLDAAMSMTTDCRQDISTPHGMGNSFAQRVHSGNVPVFIFHWRDDPRKDDDWYRKKCKEIDNPVIIAQELDLSFTASVLGILIPNEWIEASVDAHIKLGISPSGIKAGAFDVADEGRDKCAYAGRHSLLVNFLEEWAGKGDDIFGSVEKCFEYADLEEHEQFQYDGDGLGSACRGDSRVINEKRATNGVRTVDVNVFRASASGVAMHDPEGELVKERKNKDFFANMKSLSWWSLRDRFKKTYRAVNEGAVFEEHELISLSSTLPLLSKIKTELSQPTYAINTSGKVVINKQPEGTRSPNCADSIMILFNPSCMNTNRFDRWGE